MRHNRVLLFALLALLVAAIAGGGCNGSSSGSSTKASVVGDELKSELGKKLQSRLGEIGYEALIVGASEDLKAEHIEQLLAHFEGGKVVVLEAPSDKNLDRLREEFGILNSETENGTAASEVRASEQEEGNGEKSQLVMFRKVKRDVFEGSVIFVDGSGPASADVDEETARSSDLKIDPDGKDVRVGSSDAEISKMLEPRTQDVRLDEMIEVLKSWKDRTDKHADAIGKRRLGSAQDDLAQLANAYIQTIDWHFNDIKGGYKFPTIYQTITIYSCYSYDKDEDWHLVETSSVMDPENNYNHWTETGPGGCDWVQNYTRRYRSWVVHQMKDYSEGLSIHDHMPQTMNNGTVKTDSFSYNIGGSLGFQGQTPTGSISGGVTVGNSQSYTVNDYDAIDSTDGHNQDVKYEFTVPADGDRHFDYMELKDATNVSRYTFTTTSRGSGRSVTATPQRIVTALTSMCSTGLASRAAISVRRGSPSTTAGTAQRIGATAGSGSRYRRRRRSA